MKKINWNNVCTLVLALAPFAGICVAIGILFFK